MKPLATKQKGAKYVAALTVFQLQFTVGSDLLLSVASCEILI